VTSNTTTPHAWGSIPVLVPPMLLVMLQSRTLTKPGTGDIPGHCQAHHKRCSRLLAGRQSRERRPRTEYEVRPLQTHQQVHGDLVVAGDLHGDPLALLRVLQLSGAINISGYHYQSSPTEATIHAYTYIYIVCMYIHIYLYIYIYIFIKIIEKNFK
jgi:hypothetical protein